MIKNLESVIWLSVFNLESDNFLAQLQTWDERKIETKKCSLQFECWIDTGDVTYPVVKVNLTSRCWCIATDRNRCSFQLVLKITQK